MTNFFKFRPGSRTQVRLLPNLKDEVPFVPAPESQSKRFLWPCVIRGQEDQGPMLWSVSRTTHAQLLDAIQASKRPARERWYHKLWRWVRREPTPMVDALDLEDGQDISVHCGAIHHDERIFFQYDVTLAERCSAGSPEMIQEWSTKDPIREYLNGNPS